MAPFRDCRASSIKIIIKLNTLNTHSTQVEHCIRSLVTEYWNEWMVWMPCVIWCVWVCVLSVRLYGYVFRFQVDALNDFYLLNNLAVLHIDFFVLKPPNEFHYIPSVPRTYKIISKFCCNPIVSVLLLAFGFRMKQFEFRTFTMPIYRNTHFMYMHRTAAWYYSSPASISIRLTRLSCNTFCDGCTHKDLFQLFLISPVKGESWEKHREGKWYQVTFLYTIISCLLQINERWRESETGKVRENELRSFGRLIRWCDTSSD